MEKFAEVIGRSLGWAGVIYFIVMVFFLTVGYGNLGPLPAFLYGSIAFLCSLVVLLFLETLLALNPVLTRKKTYIVSLLVLCLIPIGIFLADILKENTQAVRMVHAKPLTDVERLLLNSTHLNLRVGVDNKKLLSSATSKYILSSATSKFISDLQKTCIFEEVGELDQLEKPDLIVIMNGYFRGINNGWTFKLQLPDSPEREVYKAVYYRLHILDRIFGFNSDENQYLDRLTVELIKASQALFGFDYLNYIGPMPTMTDVKSRCKNTRK